MIKLLSNYVLVRPCETPELSDGGIYTGQATTTFVQDKAKAVQRTVGEVLAVGPGKDRKNGKRFPPDAPIGSIVCFSDTCGREVEHEDETLLIIREDDIMGFLDEPCFVEFLYKAG